MKTIEPHVELIVAANNYLGESPYWSVEEQALYWINCEKPSEVHRWEEKSKTTRIWPMPQRAGGISLKKGGGLIVTLADGLYDMSIPSGELTLLISSPLEQAWLHESATDRDGRIWVGAYDRRIGSATDFTGSASLFKYECSDLVPMVNRIQCSNALAFSPDGTLLYHSDSPTGLLKVWDLDRSTGSISLEQEFAQVSPEDGYFDGATVDSEGGLWVTLVFGGKLRRYRPDKTLDLEVILPFSNPTKLAFGGPDLGTLFITTTKMSMGTPMIGENMHGGLYAFRPGYHGVPEVGVVL